MTASAANGFMNTNIADCTGTPITFHAEYSTAKQQNQVPWAALEGGVLMQQEIGHSEVCNSVKNQDPFTFGTSYSDPTVFDTCVGGIEGPGQTGEGPWHPTRASARTASTEGPNGPVACPTNDSNSGANCEFATVTASRRGRGPVTIDGVPATESSDANQCFDNRYQNGDLDFDGIVVPGVAWPDGTRNHPDAFEYVWAVPGQRESRTRRSSSRPTSARRRSSLRHQRRVGGCTVRAAGARISTRSWSLSPACCPGARVARDRVRVDFGNVLPHTANTVARTAQYGTPERGQVRRAPAPARWQLTPMFGRACAG
jgi:hypothetical protein